MGIGALVADFSLADDFLDHPGFQHTGQFMIQTLEGEGESTVVHAQ